MRRLPLLLVVLMLAACGSGAEQTGAPGSSGEFAEGSGTATGSGPEQTPIDESNPKPPPILLLYRGQEQKAAQGSYCVDQVDETSGQGSGVCADSALPIYPGAVTGVVGGDRVTFVVRDAAVRRDSLITIRPLGCEDRTVDKLRFPPGPGELVWEVDLPWGAYQLDVFARFDAADGRSGDVSATLGLTVAGPKTYDATGVHDFKRSLAVCAPDTIG